jgi:hypothetical protein
MERTQEKRVRSTTFLQCHRAAQMAEVATVPVRIVNLTDAEAMEAALVENLIRADVHPMEEATGNLGALHLENRVVELSFI